VKTVRNLAPRAAASACGESLVDLAQDSDLHVVNDQREPPVFANILERARNVESKNLLHRVSSLRKRP